MSNQRYMQRGVSASKEDVHNAIKNIDKGIFPKAFCKIITDVENTQVRTDVGKLAGVVGIFCNGLLFFGKLVAGLLSGSVAIVADAVWVPAAVASPPFTMRKHHRQLRCL